MTVDRKTSGRKIIHVARAAVSIVGGIQPGTLRRAIGREHMQDGLCARLLLAMPDPKPVTWSEAIVSPVTGNALEELLERLSTIAPAADDEGRPEPYPIPLGNDAKRLWVEYFNRHRAEQADLEDDLAAAWSKLEAYTARFALIFTLCRNRDATIIDKQSMADAIKLSDWFGGEARRVYGTFVESDEEREQRELTDWIRKRGGNVTVRQVQQGRRDCRTTEEADQKLQRLAEAGIGKWLQVTPSQSGGARREHLNCYQRPRSTIPLRTPKKRIDP